MDLWRRSSHFRSQLVSIFKSSSLSYFQSSSYISELLVGLWNIFLAEDVDIEVVASRTFLESLHFLAVCSWLSIQYSVCCKLLLSLFKFRFSSSYSVSVSPKCCASKKFLTSMYFQLLCVYCFSLSLLNGALLSFRGGIFMMGAASLTFNSLSVSCFYFLVISLPNICFFPAEFCLSFGLLPWSLTELQVNYNNERSRSVLVFSAFVVNASHDLCVHCCLCNYVPWQGFHKSIFAFWTKRQILTSKLLFIVFILIFERYALTFYWIIVNE